MSQPARRIRRAARVVLTDPAGRVLLFRFTPDWSEPFWVMPGGECDPGENFATAARRELLEETGIAGEPAALDVVHTYDFTTVVGEPVTAEEHYFHWLTDETRIDTAGHTELERAVMQEHRWFEPAELAGWAEPIYPQNAAALVSLARGMQEGLAA